MWERNGIKLILTISVALFFVQTTANANPEIIVSEIYYNSTGNDIDNEFIELYVWDDKNLGDIDLSEWNITTYDGDNETLPEVAALGNFSYIVIHMGSGINDLDASDGRAVIYLGRSTEMLDNNGDEIGIYAQDNSLVDFVRYSGGNGDPVMGGWSSEDTGIFTSNNNESIQILGPDLNNSSNWISGVPSEGEPNIYEFRI